MPTRFAFRTLVAAALALSGVAGPLTSPVRADDASLACPAGKQCRMAIPQLRVRATDNKIDWGASDYVGSGSNAATGSYTYGQAGVDGGPSGTDDDYPPSGGPSSHDVTAAGAHPHLNIFIRYCDAQSV